MADTQVSTPGGGSGPAMAGAQPAYAASGRSKVKRLWLGAFLGAVTAILAVAFVALIFATVAWTIGEVLFGGSWDASWEGSPLLIGAAGAIFASILNWYVFFISLPIATLVLRFSLGRFPGKGIATHGPYLKWGVILGSLLVSLPAMLGGYIMFGIGTVGRAGGGSGDTLQVFIGAGATGAAIGAIAGLAVAGMFLLIVRPKSQVKMADPAAAF
ncbi:MAG: hypothetical protein AAGH87_10785 [Pseudomonadota bacterium]